MTRIITAVEMARAAAVDPKAYRARLRAAKLAWHREGQPWEVVEGSDRHRQMLDILKGARTEVSHAASRSGATGRTSSAFEGRAASDGAYVIDFCDHLLGYASLRQHRFDWLVGDGARPRHLPVDAYYPELRLVVELLERQHSEEVRFFDKPDRLTVSGVHRGVQRAIYDQRRRELIPAHDLRLVEIRIDELAHDRRKRLLRLGEQDEAVIREKLRAAGILPRPSSNIVATAS